MINPTESQILDQLIKMNRSISLVSKNIEVSEKSNEENLSLLSRIEQAKESREKIEIEERHKREAEKQSRNKRFFGEKSSEVSASLRPPVSNTNGPSGEGIFKVLTSTIGKILDGQSLIPSGSTIVGKIEGLITRIFRAVNPFRIAGKLLNNLFKLIDKFFSLSVPGIGKLSETFLGKLTKSIIDFSGKVFSFIGNDLFSILLKGFDVLTLPALIWGFIRNYVKEAVGNNKFGKAMFSLIDNILQPINDYFDKIVNIIKDLFTGNFKDIKNQFRSMLSDVIDLTYGILINPIKQLFNILPNSFKHNSMVIETINWISSVSSSIYKEISSILGESLDFLGQSFKSLKGFISEFLSGKFMLSGEYLADALSYLIEIPYHIGLRIGELIRGFIPKIHESLSSTDLTDVAKNVGNNLLNLMQDIGKFIIGFVGQLVKNLVNFLPNFTPGKAKILSSIDSFEKYINGSPLPPSISYPVENQTKQSRSILPPPTSTSSDQLKTIGEEAPSSSSDVSNPAISVASSGTKRTYTLKDGTQEVRENGTRAWRNNNPGNIRMGKFALEYGAIGQDNGPDGNMAIFPTIEAGESAQRALLFQSKGYKNLTLSEAIAKYAPPSDNNPTSLYQANALKAVGGEDKKLSEYTPAQQSQILAAMTKQEGGFKAGKVSILSSTGQRIATPDEVRGTIANYGKIQPSIPLETNTGYQEKTLQQVVAENQKGLDENNSSLIDITRQAIEKANAIKKVVHRKSYDVANGNNLTISNGMLEPSSNVNLKDQEQVSRQQLEVSKSIAQNAQVANWDLDTAPYDVDLVKLNLGEI